MLRLQQQQLFLLPLLLPLSAASPGPSLGTVGSPAGPLHRDDDAGAAVRQLRATDGPRTFYVDSQLGDDNHSGTSEAAASLRTDDELPTWAMPVPDKGRPRAGLSPSPQTRRSA
jgi:hypothetical protein